MSNEPKFILLPYSHRRTFKPVIHEGTVRGVLDLKKGGYLRLEGSKAKDPYVDPKDCKQLYIERDCITCKGEGRVVISLSDHCDDIECYCNVSGLCADCELGRVQRFYAGYVHQELIDALRVVEPEFPRTDTILDDREVENNRAWDAYDGAQETLGRELKKAI